MGTPLRCLLVEDSDSDAGRIVRLLRKAGYEVVHEQVETAAQMRAALEGQVWDAVIADYRLPEFSGPAALALLKEAGLDLPFIVVSGAIGEQAAVEMMRAGAHDYLLKGDMARLAPAIERELKEVEVRRERQRAEKALRESEVRFRSFVEGAPDGIFVATKDRFQYLNGTALKMFGAASDVELLHLPTMDRIHPDSRVAVAERIRRVDELRTANPPTEERYLKLDGTVFDVEVSAVPCSYGGEDGRMVFFRDITQRKQMQAALRQIEERALLLADMLERSSQPFAVAYPDGRMGMVNAAYCALVGYTQDELASLTWETDLTPPEWRDFEAACMEDLLLTGGPLRYEKEYVHKNGSRVPVEILVHLVRGSAEAPSYYYAFLTNLTERRQAQEALRASELRYRELFENSQLGIYRTTPDGRILLANPALLAMLGYDSLEELAERNLEEEGFQPGYDRNWFRDAIERHGAVRGHEARWTRRDGAAVFVRENANVIRNSAGAVLFYDGTVEDITERKRIADALLVSEERFRQVAEDAGVFVWEVDPNGLYTYASSAVESMLGYTPEELVGKLCFYHLFVPEVRESLKAAATQAFAEKRSFQTFVNPNLTKDGRTVILETNGAPMSGAAGELLGYRGADKDVTERVRAIEELRRHRDHLEELVGKRTAELERQNNELADEVFAHSLALKALKRSETRLQLQLDCMPIGSITIGLDFRIQSWNPAAEHIFGYSKAEAIGAAAIDLLVPEDLRSEMRKRLLAFFEAAGPSHRVNEGITKDGRRMTCEWTNTRLFGADGEVRGALCMVQDITSRKQTEEIIRQKTEELETFNKAMIGRETRLIELKEEVNRLCAEMGRHPAYPPVWSGEKQ